MTEDEMHAVMAAEYAKQCKGPSTEEPIPIKLPPDLEKQLRHFMASRNISAPQALATITSQFFGRPIHG